MKRIASLILVCTMVFGLLMPKLSALAMHLHPGIMTAVLCTGSELIVIHIGADGQRKEVVTDDHVACVTGTPIETAPHWRRWFIAPRSFQIAFVAIQSSRRESERFGFLPDQRAPPV